MIRRPPRSTRVRSSAASDVYKRQVTVYGRLAGNIVAKDRIELRSGARVMGDIKGKRLIVEDGVSFVGKSEINASGEDVGVTGSDSADNTPAVAEADDNSNLGGVPAPRTLSARAAHP